ncbi:MAG: helix-turn-helix domain-containing protein [Acidimicrobiales bacterium]
MTAWTCPGCGAQPMTTERRCPPLDARTGTALGRVRRSLGWSYRQAAKQTGVAAGHLHAIEHGNRPTR